jgi:hypothetical protein
MKFLKKLNFKNFIKENLFLKKEIKYLLVFFFKKIETLNKYDASEIYLYVFLFKSVNFKNLEKLLLTL